MRMLIEPDGGGTGAAGTGILLGCQFMNLRDKSSTCAYVPELFDGDFRTSCKASRSGRCSTLLQLFDEVITVLFQQIELLFNIIGTLFPLLLLLCFTSQAALKHAIKLCPTPTDWLSVRTLNLVISASKPDTVCSALVARDVRTWFSLRNCSVWQGH